MGYQVLARKYRPQRFSDVAGQDHVTRTLINALTQKRIAHGYIFSGHRGIGKTTIARILAMALDCRTEVGTPDRPTVEPCLHCVSCREISSGGNADGSNASSHSFDFIEIDAASNRGIDDVRSICSQADVRPARDKYKIFLLDEAHQITDAAFNAILKTLEEPPGWAIFMMATTEPESIPQTIRSRCQHFSFHAVKFDDIFSQLKAIAEKEEVTADDAALALLAEAGDGSMRDALSIMDQAIASAPLENGRAVLQSDQIRDLMGAVPNAVFERLMEAVSAHQSATLMQDLDQLISSGNSPSALARQLVRYLRNCLMAKLGGENSSLLAIAYDERARAARTAVLFTEEELTRNLQIALRTFDELNYRQEQRFHLELGLLKLIQAQRLLPMEEILSGLSNSASQSGARKPSVSPSTTASRPTTQAPSRPAPPSPPPLSPFAASNQRAVEVAISRPVHDLPRAVNTGSEVGQGLSQAKLDEGPRQEGPVKGHDFSRADKPNQISGALAPEASSFSIQPSPHLTGVITEPVTDGALALAEASPQYEAAPPTPETGPQIVPPIAAASQSAESTDDIRNAVAQTLSTGGHATAAVLIEDGKWIIEGSSVRIEVNAKPTMIRLTFNAAAEKLIRQALSQAGAPSRFLIVPDEGLATSGAAPRVRTALGSIENEARAHPLVIHAQSIFNAEIVSVVDLREK
jgi:DNA polymerase III subunit gamma/tau